MTKYSSNRLTEKWTPTLDQAFGTRGTKGREGEEFLARVFDSWGWEYKLNVSDRQAQLEGRDIEFRKPSWKRFYSTDVKNNMNSHGTFYVYADWLFKVKCDRIFHVNPETGWITFYPVDKMRQAYDTTKPYMTFTTRDRLPFMKSSRNKDEKSN